MPDSRDGLRLLAQSAGERTVPGVGHENYWWARHDACYAFVRTRLAGWDRSTPAVLDAGSGEGFGASGLAGAGARVLALDYDPAATRHHAHTYPDVPVARANLVGLPVRTGSVDLLASLQTIEHVWDQRRFVAECSRVLRPGGRAVLSTPNRLTFPPGNVFHHRELDADELAELLASSFPTVTIQGFAHGPRLTAWEREHGSIVDAQIAAPPERWPSALAEAVRGVTADDFVLTDDLAGCLDLVAEAVAA